MRIALEIMNSSPDSGPEQPGGDPDGELKDEAFLDEDAITADVSDFVADFLDDEADGAVRSLSTYISRYPRAQEQIALEYLRLKGEVDGARMGSDGGDGGAPGVAVQQDDGARRVGRYRLRRLLGQGGQGEVWLAEDEALQRPVALKLLSGRFVTEDRRQRFRREAESIARLEHPGLAHVHDADVDGDEPFIAMRFVEGHDLAKGISLVLAGNGEGAEGFKRVGSLVPWIPSSKAELFRVIRFFERAARALHAAHEAGVVHRDVKPGNIMITPDGDPVLLDFGLARDTSEAGAGPLEDGRAASHAPLTREGDVFGTLAYMAPEQLRGELDFIDARVDVWALGVTLFEALTGERPFQGKAPLEIARAIEAGGAALGKRGDRFSTDVSVVLATALEPGLERRYPTALALADDLRRIVEYEPIRARPAGPLLRLGRWCRREPAWAAALGVTLVALLAGLVITQLNLRQERALNNQIVARERASAVPALNERSPAGALALGLDALERDDTWLIRSTLYGPLLDTTLLHALKMPRARVWDALHVDGERVLAGSAGGAIGLFDASVGKQLAGLKLDADVMALGHERGAAMAFAGLADGSVVGLDSESLEERWRVACGSGQVRDLEARDGRVFATVDRREIVALDAETGGELARFQGDGDAIARLLLSADGSVLVAADTVVSRRSSVGRSRRVCVLDASDLSLMHTWDHPTEVTDVAIAPDAGRLASMDAAGTARVFDLWGGQEVASLPLRGGVVGTRGARVALSPDGSRIALGYEPPRPSLTEDEVKLAPTIRVCLVDRPEPGPEPEFSGWSGAAVTTRVLALAFSPSGDRLAAADFFGRVHVWKAADGTDHREHTDRARMTDLRFSPDGSRLVSFGVSASLYVWRMTRSESAFRVAPIDGTSPRPVVWGRFCADGRRVALLEASGRAAVFAAPLPGDGADPAGADPAGVDRSGVDPASAGSGPEPGDVLFALDASSGEPSARATERPLARLAVSTDGGVALWIDPAEGVAVMTDLLTGNRLQRAKFDDWNPGALRSLDVVRCGPGHAAALLVDVKGVAWLWKLGMAATPLTPAAASDGWVLGAFRGASGANEVVLVASLREIRQLPGVGTAGAVGGKGASGGLRLEEPVLPGNAPRGVTAIDVAPDGSELVASTDYGRVYRWDLSTGGLRSGDESRLKAAWIRLLDEDRVVVAARGPGTNRVLGGATHVAPAAHHSFVIRSMAVSPQASLCLTGSSSGTVLAWDLASGEPLIRTSLHGGAVHCVAAHGARADLRILSCGDDGALVLPLNVADAARSASPRGLSSLDEADVETLLGSR